MLYNDYKTRKLRRIDYHEYLNFLGTAKDLGILEGDAKDYLYAPSKDFITTRPERLYDSLERLAFRVQISWLLVRGIPYKRISRHDTQASLNKSIDEKN
jgi:hypothetical protein